MKFGIRELLFVIVMVGLLACSYLLVFEKANAHRQSLRHDIDARLTDMSNLRLATAGIADMSRKIDEIQRAITFFESKLPQQKELDKILTEVTNKARENQLETHTFKTQKIEKSAGYSELPIQMSLSGDFTGFYAFLLQLERLPRITRITQMDLKKINNQEGQMQASITLSIFFEPDTNAMAGIN